MKNLEQIRAKHVLDFAQNNNVRGVNGGEVVKKIPPIIMNHGLLAALAYAYSFNDRESGWKDIFNAIAVHLASNEINIVPANNVRDCDTLIRYLTSENATSETLKLSTAESMAWLDYARRFVK